MTTTSCDLFAFLEANVRQVQEDRRRAGGPAVDAVLRALELTSDEWSEEEAAAELAGLLGHKDLLVGQRHLLALLSVTPFAQRRGIRAARIMWSALDRSSASNG